MKPTILTLLLSQSLVCIDNAYAHQALMLQANSNVYTNVNVYTNAHANLNVYTNAHANTRANSTILRNSQQIETIEIYQGILDRLLTDAQAPGVAFAILKDGQLVAQGQKGMSDLETKQALQAFSTFRMASVSKQFTAFGIHQCIQAGLLTYETTLGQVFPDAHPEVKKVTIAQLLNHTSGLIDYENLIPKDQQHQVSDRDALRLINEAAYSESAFYFSPGSQFRYSNTGFCILSLVVEAVSQQAYPEYMELAVFKPLGMDLKQGLAYLYDAEKSLPNRSFGYRVISKGTAGQINKHSDLQYAFADQSITSATKGDGCVYLSVPGYVEFASQLLHASSMKNNYHIANHLDENSKSERTDEAVDMKAYLSAVLAHQFPVKDGISYSHGWFVAQQAGSTQLFHSGETSGFRNLVYHHLEKGLSIVIFSNRNDALIGDLFEQFMRSLGEEHAVNGSLFHWMSGVYNGD